MSGYSNFYERQKFMFKYVRENGIPTFKQRVEFAKQWGCHYSAIWADVVCYFKPKGLPTYPTTNLKRKVKERDKHTCQYCGKRRGIKIAEHVIPTILGGVGMEYNLVCACDSCNMKKSGGKVWVPKNIETLRQLNGDWADRIIELSTQNKCSITTQ